MLICLLLLAIPSLEGTSLQDPLVVTPVGPLRGVRADNGEYNMYLGVPYGILDEDNPFGEAKPHPGFSSPFEAVSDSVICPQYSGAFQGDINCLNLNIYVPSNVTSGNKLPVMFFIPGGAFFRGHGNRENFGPELLIKHDVIIITINYRVGIYGFLCLDIPGYNNQGIKDQILALKWMKDNIESFGGDINRVTVFGQSAGAMSLDLLLLVKEPLFQRVIIQSGSVLSPWVIGKRDNDIPINIAKRLGFVTDNVKIALDYLKSSKVADVMTATNDLRLYSQNLHPLTKPCVEEEYDDALLTDYPINLKPKVKNIDIIIGHAFREASFIYPNLDETFYENYTFDIELIKDFNEVLDEKDVRHFYIGDSPPSFDLRNKILDYGSDFAFVHPTERSIKRYLEESARNVYYYVFAYEGDRNRNKIRLNLTSEGAGHGDDLGYLWNSNLFSEQPNESDQKMIDIITKLWTDFAKYGDPTPKGPTELIPLTWRPILGEERPYLLIDSPLSLQQRPFNERMVFWDMYYKLHSDKIKGIKS